MFDFIYTFSEWFLTYDFANGWVYDSDLGSQYEFYIVSAIHHSVYILTLILMILLIWFVISFAKAVVYMVLDSFGF
jgi:hypothetical protein